MKKFLVYLFVMFLCVSFIQAQDNTFFPDLNGWKKPEKTDVYRTDNLWDIIDGAADGYLAYDFEELTVGDYTAYDGKYITLEIYRHKTSEDAFGIYSQERPSKANYIPVGGQGYQEEANLNFFAGRYYIKIRCNGKSDEEVKSVRKLGETIAQLIDPNTKLPSQLALLPVEGKIANSEQYINQNFMGYGFFKNAFIANYSVNGKLFNIFIIANPSATEAKTMLQDFLKNNGKEQTNVQPGVFDIKDKYNGMMKIIWKDKYLCGVYNTGDTKILQDYTALIDMNLK